MKAVNKEHRILVVDGYSETLRIKIEKYTQICSKQYYKSRPYAPTWCQGISEVNIINKIRIPHGCMNTLWTMVSAK